MTQGEIIKPGELIKPLHGLRGMAAMTVVVGHYGFPGSTGLGVVLFFVLSGFLMGKLYLPKNFEPRTVWLYVSARFARVYPLFAFVVIATALINVAIPEANIFELKTWQVDDHLLLYGSNMTIWTICVEFQFYLWFVLFWWLTSRFGHSMIFATVAFAAGLIWATLTFETNDFINIFGYLQVFALGIMVALVGNDTSRINKNWAHIALLAALAMYGVVYIVAAQFGIYREIYINVWALIACGAIVWASMAAGDCWANRMLSLPVAVWLGEVSFGMYLLHRPVQIFTNKLYLTELPTIIELPLRFAILFAVSHLALVLLERPCRTYLRGLSERAFVPTPASQR